MMFIEDLRKIINTGQARVIVLTGNIYDLFRVGDDYAPLLELLSQRFAVEPKGKFKGITQLICKLNNPIEIRGDRTEAIRLWSRINADTEKGLLERFKESNRNATYALELLRQVTEVYRRSSKSENNLLIAIEAADLLIPECEINRMSIADRQRVAIVHDWFSDPDFINGGDTVILLAESRSQIHHRISRLPQVVSVEIPLPNQQERRVFIDWQQALCPFNSESGLAVLSELTAGLSIHAIRQLLKSGEVSRSNVSTKVEEYMTSQLGEGVVEFTRPDHGFDEVIGFSRTKDFMQSELIPAFLDGDISGAAVSGPIGSGKTFICEAAAAEIGIPVIVLKNIRSKWYGETDQIFERLKRLLESFHRIMIFVDEADAQFGAIDDGHATERRLTGKIQAMMSDPRLKGKVIWLLMTARIHRLSPDIRRPGRMDLIIPILDPEGDDRKAFLSWCLGDFAEAFDEDQKTALDEITEGYSAAAFAGLKKQIKIKKPKDPQALFDIINDMVLPNIGKTREYQKLQAQLNCTRKSLIFTPEAVDNMSRPGKDSSQSYEQIRDGWRQELKALEREGFE